MNPTNGPLYTVENCAGFYCDVYLNDELISKVIEAHTEQGYLIRYADSLYQPGMEEYPTERLTGSVRVDFAFREHI